MSVMDIEAIKAVIPHRSPMLLVDEVLELGVSRIIAVRTFEADEWFFQGHFPDNPVLPGVMALEAMAQAGAILLLSCAENVGRIPLFLGAEDIKWHRPIRPGETVTINANILEPDGKIQRGTATLYVGEKLAAETVFSCRLMRQRTR